MIFAAIDIGSNAIRLLIEAGEVNLRNFVKFLAKENPDVNKN